MTAAVITGVGVVSPMGVGLVAFLDGLAAGRSAIGPIGSFDASTFPTTVAGEVPVGQVTGSWMREHLDNERVDLWEGDGVLRERKVVFALLAAAEAWRAAGCAGAERDAWLSIALGLEQAYCEDFAPVFDGTSVNFAADAAAPLPAMRYRSQVDLAAGCVSDLLGLRGPRVVHTSACAAGAMAVAHGASLIERGAADVVLCGAADSMVNPLGLGGMAVLGTTSPRNEPDACRPFDRRRDGLAMGEGAAMFVLESSARARARGARPIARVLGAATTQDAYKLSAPRPDGACAQRAMSRAIEAAGLRLDQIDYVNAHGTGTPLNDPAEARAIRSLFGDYADSLPVSSIKGAVGHAMAASGALELAACLLGFERGLLPGTANHRERDPDCDIAVIGPEPRTKEPRHVLSNSFGFGGQNCSVVLGRAE